MKYCTGCGYQCDDSAPQCPQCGKPFAAAEPADPRDHTAEYDPKDISDNKVVAMAPYLLGAIGLIIAAILAPTSEYAKFHVRTSLKLLVVECILIICSALLCWTVIVPIAGAICLCIVAVLQVICFFNVCNGKAKDPAIICNLKFLK